MEAPSNWLSFYTPCTPLWRQTTPCLTPARLVPVSMHTAKSGKDHYGSYRDLRDKPTTEADMPSYKRPVNAPRELKELDRTRPLTRSFKLTQAQAVGSIPCEECVKPRVVYGLSRFLAPPFWITRALCNTCWATTVAPASSRKVTPCATRSLYGVRSRASHVSSRRTITSRPTRRCVRHAALATRKSLWTQLNSRRAVDASSSLSVARALMAAPDS